MTGNSASERFRRVVTGICLIAGPLGLLIGMALHPEESRDATRQLAIIGADPDRWELAHFLIAGSAVVMAGAVLGLAHLIHERRPGYAIVGGAMGLVGACSLTAVAFAEATFGAELGRVEGAAVVTAFSAASAGPAFLAILLGALMGPLSAIVLGAGGLAADVMPRWAAMAQIAGGALLTVSLPAGVTTGVVAGSALMVLGLAPIGVMVLRETSEEWSHTPTHRMSAASG